MNLFKAFMLAGVTTCALAAESPTVVVLPFENATGRPDLKVLEKGFPELVTAFLGTTSIQVVEREKLEMLMAEKGLAWENLLKDARRAGQLAQARYVLKGSFTGEDRRLNVSALLYETESTRLVKSIKGSGRPAEAAEAVASGVAQVFSTPLKPLAALPADEDPEKSLHFIYGLGYYHQGRFHKAYPEFMKILAKDPRQPDAKYWLGKSFLEAGLKPQAALEFKQFLEWFAKDSRVSEVKALMARTGE